MFSWWYFGLIGCSCVFIIYCQANDPTSEESDEEIAPPFEVHLAVDVPLTTPIDTTTIDSSEYDPLDVFKCFECTDCNLKSKSVSQICDQGIDSCYTIKRRVNNRHQVVRRGCSKSKGKCVAPSDDDYFDTVDSVTCCSKSECNYAGQIKPMMILSILSVLIAVTL